jgi:hypothetical protein
MQPGQSFTKTWRLQNAGSCTWTKSYTIALFSGDAMGATTSVPLPAEVPPGQTVDISIDMVAPLAAATYQGNWKLRNAASTWFGIGPNGGSPFWVRIVVASGATATLTTTVTTTPTNTPVGIITATSVPPTATSAPTATSGPAVQVSGSASLTPPTALDLDSNQTGAGGEDLAYTVNADNKALLSPQSGASIGVFGADLPSLATCQAVGLGTAGLLVENLSNGTFLCYRTNNGLYGRARILNYHPATFTLTLDILTWAQH